MEIGGIGIGGSGTLFFSESPADSSGANGPHCTASTPTANNSTALHILALSTIPHPAARTTPRLEE
jgi:hypothetical protein